MKNLSKKIQKTMMFSDAQKVDLLVALQSASEEDKKKLAEGIDIFDRAYGKAVKKHTAQIASLMGHLERDMTPEETTQNEEALAQMKLGLSLLL